jgi:histone arginine demethylase JMJD6
MEIQKMHDISYASFMHEFCDAIQPFDINIFEPDFQKFPKFKEATLIHFIESAGETLVFPLGTWHTAYFYTATISVAFDQQNDKNYSDNIGDEWSFKKRENKMKAIAKTGYAWQAGRPCHLESNLNPIK